MNIENNMPYKKGTGGEGMIKCERSGARLIAKLSGELDHASSAGVRNEIEAHMRDARITELVFDLRELTFMDSSGLGVILGRYRTLSARGGSVAICGAKGQTDRLLNMSGVYRMVKKIG